jgi:hypothetical protein
MNEVDQLASVMLVVAFAAVTLVAGKLYMENRSPRPPAIPSSRDGISAPFPYGVRYSDGGCRVA